MKKFIQFSVLIALVAVLAFAAFQAPASGSAIAGRPCPMVGWNTSPLCRAEAPTYESFAWSYFIPGDPGMDVGWNT